MYVGFNRFVKKVPKKHSNNPNEPEEEAKGDEQIDPNTDIFIGEEDGDHIYIDKDALKESLKNSQILSALLYESEQHLS